MADVVYIVVLCAAMATLAAIGIRGERHENLRIFLHDTVLYKNSSFDTDTRAVPGSSSMGTALGQFGAIYVFDDPLTSKPAMNSPHIGTAQGLYAYTSRSNVSAFWAFTAFLHGRGSLSIMGAEVILGSPQPRLLTVVGGTGDFSLARGTVSLNAVAFIVPTYFVLSLDIALVLP